MTNRFGNHFTAEERAALAQALRDLSAAPGHLAATADRLHDEVQTVIDIDAGDVEGGYPIGTDGYPRAFRVGDVVEHRDITTGPREIVACIGASCMLDGPTIKGLTTLNLAQAGDLRIITPAPTPDTSTIL